MLRGLISDTLSCGAEFSGSAVQGGEAVCILSLQVGCDWKMFWGVVKLSISVTNL